MKTLIDGTPSYCYREGELDAHDYEASLELEPFEHGPITIAQLRVTCPGGDEIGLELGRTELLTVRDRINAILQGRR